MLMFMMGFARASDLAASAAFSMIWRGPCTAQGLERAYAEWRARKRARPKRWQWSEGLIGDVADEPR